MVGGCAIRLFTTVELAGADPLLLYGFGFGLALNGALLAQVSCLIDKIQLPLLIRYLAKKMASYLLVLAKYNMSSSSNPDKLRYALNGALLAQVPLHLNMQR